LGLANGKALGLNAGMPAEPPSPEELKSLADLERYKSGLAAWLEHYKLTLAGRLSSRNHRADSLRLGQSGMLEYARAACRGGLILNGGGSLGTTTMLAASLQSGRAATAAPVLAVSLAFFAAGALLPVLTTGFSYLSQHHYNVAMLQRAAKSRKGDAWRFAALVALWASGVCFVAGTAWTVCRLPTAIVAAGP
jgi:hypothetical protein